MNILIADDSKPVRAMLRALLEEGGHEVVEANDGAEAMRILTGPTPPSIAILDWSMPVADGVEICRKVRALPGRPFIYLILLTVNSRRGEVLDGLRSGANDYITKPFDEEALLARVQIGLEMVKLHRSLNCRVLELERANQELEAFSRMVAHDLRTPLHAISSFASLLLEEPRPSLQGETAGSITEIRRLAGRMDETIDALMGLARATRGELHRQPVDLGQVARETVVALRRRNPERSVEFRVAGDLGVTGDSRLLGLVLQNLIGNAWKFTGRQPEARIDLVELESDGERTFVVRDNGVGFDAGQSARAFAPFQRFHSDPDFEGSGIGLTIVQRIVERHGGRIWVESAVGNGAAFHFTLGLGPHRSQQLAVA